MNIIVVFTDCGSGRGCGRGSGDRGGVKMVVVMVVLMAQEVVVKLNL